jgi:hypothetical protein
LRPRSPWLDAGADAERVYEDLRLRAAGNGTLTAWGDIAGRHAGSHTVLLAQQLSVR